MRYAVLLYKKSGGSYVGPKSPANALRVWTKEQWDYIGAPKQSRYLPKAVRDALTPGEKAATSKEKTWAQNAASSGSPNPPPYVKKQLACENPSIKKFFRHHKNGDTPVFIDAPALPAEVRTLESPQSPAQNSRRAR